MKKILAIAAPLILVIVSAKSQSEKREPPPPSPKPKQEIKYTIGKEDKVKNPSQTVIEEKVNAGKPLKPPVVTAKGKEADDFYQRNPTVSAISRQGSVMTIKNKAGTTKKYDMNNNEESKIFTEKYGVSPIPPPPPPPKVVKEKKLS